jgi:replicative DNA helicase
MAYDLKPDQAALISLPANLEAEQALIGAVMFDNAAIEGAERITRPQFFEPFHGRLWEAMTRKIAAGMLADPITLADEFRADEAFAGLGGVVYLADLIDRAPPARVVPSLAATVADVALARSLALMAREIEATALSGETGANTLEAAERALHGLAEAGETAKGFVPLSSALDGALLLAEAAYQRQGGLAGISTGLIDLDQRLGGLAPSDLLILAGRPSMGKTALATNIAFNAARAGAKVGFFSLEMSGDQLGLRILADVAGISSDRIRKGRIDMHEYAALRDAREEIANLPLHIDETGAISLARLTARARRLQRKHGLDLIIVDYLQLITMGGKTDNRTVEVGAIAAGLKALAKDLKVPVVALSQLSRKVEERPDKRPQLADLRESGSIEQDADVVLFVYRESYYLARTEPDASDQIKHMEWTDKMSKVQGLAEVIIGKLRQGPIGTVRLSFNEELTRFGNLARDGQYGDAR